ncbi:Tar ligand binding domain-containing protein [Sinorhizobium medicae]
MTALRVPNRLGSHLSVRLRLWLALAALALATLVVGGASWATLRQTSTRLDRLHDQSLARVDDALTLSRKATAVAARAPFLLTIESPFRLQVEAGISKTLLADIRRHLDGQNALFDKLLTEMGGSIDELTTLSLHRIELNTTGLGFLWRWVTRSG